MRESPTVSTIIPTYNRAHAVCAAIESALAQTYAPVELIVVDDGSTDDTRARLQKYGDRIRVLRQQNSGPSAARNAGAKVSKGDILAFLDSDDLWLPSKLQDQVSILTEAGSSVCCCLCDMTLLFKDGRAGSAFESACIKPAQFEGVWTNAGEVLCTRFVMFNQAAAIRREAFEAIGGFDERLSLLEDYDLAFKLSLLGPWVFLHKALGVWQQSKDSLSTTDEVVQKQSELEVRERLLRSLAASGTQAGFRRLLRSNTSRVSRELAALKLCRSSSRYASLLGEAFVWVEGVRRSLSRRSPWYPKMQTIPIDKWTPPRPYGQSRRSVMSGQ